MQNTVKDDSLYSKMNDARHKELTMYVENRDTIWIRWKVDFWIPCFTVHFWPLVYHIELSSCHSARVAKPGLNMLMVKNKRKV